MSGLRIAGLRAALEKIGQTGCRCRTSSIKPCRACVARESLRVDDLLAMVGEHTDSYAEDPDRPHRPSFSPQYDDLPHVSHPHRNTEPCTERCTRMVLVAPGRWEPEKEVRT
jgi:hypothetical protein